MHGVLSKPKYAALIGRGQKIAVKQCSSHIFLFTAIVLNYLVAWLLHTYAPKKGITWPAFCGNLAKKQQDKGIRYASEDRGRTQCTGTDRIGGL